MHILASRRGLVVTLVVVGLGLASACGGSAASEFDGGGEGSSGGTSGTSGLGTSGASGGTSGASGTSGGDGDGGCGGTAVGAAPRKVNVLLVVDKSGSMSREMQPGVTRWDALESAIDATIEGSKTKIAYGLKLFPNKGVSLGCSSAAECCQLTSSAIDVGVGPGTATVPTIKTSLTSTSPGGATPTGSALEAAATYFTTGAGKSLEGDKFVLLATDGGPNCGSAATCDVSRCTYNIDGQCPGGTNCCDPASGLGDGKGCLDDSASVAQVQALAAVGVKTIVVGIPGTEAYTTTLDQLAEAGGARNPAPPPKFYAVSATGGVAGLTNVLSTITGSLIKSCRLQLQSAPPDLDQLNVFVDGALVPQAGADGWELDGSTTPATVAIKGATCKKIETQGASSVEIRYGCPTVIVR